MSQFNSYHPLISNESPWINNNNTIWLASTLTINRNLERFNFVGRINEEKRLQILNLLAPALLKNMELKNSKLVYAHEMPPIEKEFFVEHFLSSQGFHHASKGDAFIIEEKGEFLATINLRDHLSLQYVDVEEELEKTWEKLNQIENKIENIDYAFNSKFGFLTADPTLCGTGLVASVFLHLPALIMTDSLTEVVGKNKDDSLALTGLQGDPTDLVGDIVSFHNLYTLGLTEENILTSLRTIATKMISEEKNVRNHLQTGKGNDITDIKDKVSRAFGVLLHSYQIEAVEALHYISLLKLGLELKWIQGTTHEALNELLFSSRRAHLLCYYNQDKISQEELLHRRAEYIHRALKGIELLI